MGSDARFARALMVLFAIGGCASPAPLLAEPTTSEIAAADVMSSDARYLATVSAMVEGTEYEGLPEADPQGFLATADTLCQMLDNGATWDDVLARYLAQLATARGTEADDDAVLAGTLVGAAVEIYCPEYAEELP